MEVPEEYGGPGLSLFQRTIVVEELSRTIALPARGEGITGPSVRHILFTLTGELKEKYLMPVLRGEKKVAFAQTEPDAGSDPGGMRTTAVKRRQPLRHQRHQALHHRRQQGALHAADGGDRPRQGLAWRHLLLPGRHGHARREARHLLPDHDGRPALGDHPRQRARAGRANLVGEEGKGFGLAQKWLGAGRVKHGARALGVAERCLEMATSYAKQRSTFGRPLADRQAIQWKLADMYIELQAARLLVYKAATRLDAGEDAREDCYVCKYYADEMAFRAADECMQIHGGIALTTDLPIEKFWRQQRSYRITEGASEVMKMVIARHVLKTYG